MIVLVALPVPLNRTFDYLAPDVDGALVGGAALEARSFADIIKNSI